MSIEELYSLYKCISKKLRDENMDYSPEENAMMNLYLMAIHGCATRRDFLIYAIQDMLNFIKVNNIKEIQNTLIVKFNQTYCK